MILTIKDARTKRCHKNMRDYCIADHCMAWRFVTKTRDVGMEGHPAPDTIVIGGYCGLAGVPTDLNAE